MDGAEIICTEVKVIMVVYDAIKGTYEVSNMNGTITGG